MNEPTKVVVMGDDPESFIDGYEDKDLIIVYPRGKRPGSKFLLKKNVVRIFSDYSTFPDIETLTIIRDTLLYLLNSSAISTDDRVLFIFEKEGEHHRLFFDMRKLQLPILLEMLSDRLDGEIVEYLLKLSMSIVKKGREGVPAGALFIVGDSSNVMRYVVSKIANPVKGIDRRMRFVLDENNFDTIREFAIMDGATVVDRNGYLIASGVYVKNLAVDEWFIDGFGGRHLAARAITKLTKAISFVVSSEGTIRIYRDGKMIYEFNNF